MTPLLDVVGAIEHHVGELALQADARVHLDRVDEAHLVESVIDTHDDAGIRRGARIVGTNRQRLAAQHHVAADRSAACN